MLSKRQRQRKAFSNQHGARLFSCHHVRLSVFICVCVCLFHHSCPGSCLNARAASNARMAAHLPTQRPASSNGRYKNKYKKKLPEGIRYRFPLIYACLYIMSWYTSRSRADYPADCQWEGRTAASVGNVGHAVFLSLDEWSKKELEVIYQQNRCLLHCSVGMHAAPLFVPRFKMSAANQRVFRLVEEKKEKDILRLCISRPRVPKHASLHPHQSCLPGSSCCFDQ